jgi:hypothetical protein
VKPRFIRGFWDFWCFDVVFLWSACGVLRGKDGFQIYVFRALIFLQFFQIYFSTA